MQGVEDFMRFVRDGNRDAEVMCPCMRCMNVRYWPQRVVEVHLLLHRMDPTYHRWVHHGENGEPHDAPVAAGIDQLNQGG